MEEEVTTSELRIGVEKETQVPTLVEEFPGFLKLYDDGRIVRSEDLIVSLPLSVNTRDVVVDEALGLWVRLFLPPQTPTSSKLTVGLFFHGGGFCFFSPAYHYSHTFCEKWAASFGVMIVSVNHRLAPEHRLPAAYDDSMAVLQWLFSTERASDPWLDAHADLSNVFVMGESSGGNIVHHLLLRVHACDIFNNIRGAILIQSFFSATDRTHSENVCPLDVLVTVEACDRYWRLALPLEAHGNRNHPFSNPVMYLPSQFSGVISIPPMLVVVAGKDCLRDRGVEYYEAIKSSGKCKHIDLMVFENEDHGFHRCFRDKDEDNPTAIRELMRKAELFLASNSH
ncbi:hypothetical protein SUGI_0208340 [Cryptomeria japonica]|uniref:probable carboxylesterase 15 n=1 Tax=Cryptomeria japonica TaxID=3369 RepID=UPI0024089B93|nr:probable carboxylesterase 15 [Cryptomeria japonica]GLJ13230.1 hypothetical protein SUGI_0208340 [Cryptomeria japonica]